MILVGPLKHACGTQNNSSKIFLFTNKDETFQEEKELMDAAQEGG